MKTLEDHIAIDARGLQIIHSNYGFTKDRPFWLCPQCEKRTAKLYLKDGQFACRDCHKLLYKTDLLSPKQRMIARAKKVRRELGGSENLLIPFPDKPKEMHYKAYAKLMIQDRRTRRECTRIIFKE